MDRPGAVLFACTENALRSPMAEGIAKYLVGHEIFIDSVGVRKGELDMFAVAAMDEIGIDISGHKPKRFDDLEDSSFDLILSLSPEAQHRAVDMTRIFACEVEYWNTFDPSLIAGSREQKMAAYREVRDALLARIKDRLARPVPVQP
ncbi:MAG: arsenate reductase ArsC [Sneathiellaceae bacterium]